ncbi:MAG: phosphoglycerate kinase [Candidatus Pacebacteria bacterium]|jgi:3-phosphoglycerate kinase|nr:phosphoglycerate kinase [Candidatus Paceibacterota bacterium]|tara:strand:+ start:8162 stop:9292 length:1131 start_codon:yes stop_codon:yes gene_type:complete
MKLKNIQDVKDLKGKRVLLRATLNVPVKEGKVTNDFRLRRTLKTIRFLQEESAKIIMIGHIGRDASLSLYPVYEYFKKYLPISFAHEIFGEKTNIALNKIKNGEVVLLENLRTNEGERGNNKEFAKKLASMADIYVNDAFSVSHREHASVVSIPQYLSSYAGFLLQEEVEELSHALNPPSSSLCILGGAKFITKESLIEKLLGVYGKVYISGALAHDFFKMHGYNIGKSLISNIDVDLKALVSNKKIMIPLDVAVENADGVFIKKPEEVSSEDNIADAGPETAEQLEKLVQDSKFVLWNGPLGEYERGFIKPTEKLAYAIAKSPIKSVIGGGDTMASIAHLGLEDKFSFVSTGGGAMLRFLLDGTLVGIEKLKNNK